MIESEPKSQASSDAPESGSSPRATGPAGGQFEVLVATHYALSLLAATQPFGFPGVVVKRIAFQRADQDHPLDDIIITGTDEHGDRVLEVQAKRSLSFTKSDEKFQRIVADMVAARRIDATRRFAVAIERTTSSIENGVQEALELARYTTDNSSFRGLLQTPGRSNSKMRAFVKAFDAHLATAGEKSPSVAYEYLRAFSVLVFDFARPNSIAEQSDKWRAQQLGTGKTDLYSALATTLLRTDAIGGDVDRNRLLELLNEQGVRVAGAPSLASARSKLREMSDWALLDIENNIAGVQLLRHSLRVAFEDKLDAAAQGSGVLEITGSGGVGKSALLKSIAESRGNACRMIVLAPDRVPPGGWSALQHQLGIDAPAEEFLSDLSCDGGGILFVDGLDRFRSDAERKTVTDLVIAATRTPTVVVVFTARNGWAQVSDFSEALISAVETRETLEVPPLTDDEASPLADAVPQIAELLAPGHQAAHLARNPFILKRLASTGRGNNSIATEAELARDWWVSGAHCSANDPALRRFRRRVLVAVIEAQLQGVSVVDLRPEVADARAVEALLQDGILVELATDRVKFKHDLFVDWAVAAYLEEDTARIMSLALSAPPFFWLLRGIELAFRSLAERDEKESWTTSIAELRKNEANSEWLGIALLALVRSEKAAENLERHQETILADDGDLAASLIRRVIAAETNLIDDALAELLPDGMELPKGFSIPAGRSWVPLLAWVSCNFHTLPALALSASVQLIQAWLILTAVGEDQLAPLLLQRLAQLLINELERKDSRTRRAGDIAPQARVSADRETVFAARTNLALYAKAGPEAAERYLRAIAASRRPADEMGQVLEFAGNLPAAAPTAFSQALVSSVRAELDRQTDSDRDWDLGISLSRIEHPFALGRCGASLFESMFQADADGTIQCVREIISAVEAALGLEGRFDIVISGNVRAITPTSSYGWSRGQCPSRLINCSLAALAHWAQSQADSGVPIGEIIGKISGDGPVSAALLLVIVDTVLNCSELGGAELHDLLASPELLSLDERRSLLDKAGITDGGTSSGGLYPVPPGDRLIEEALSSRKSIGMSLQDALLQVAISLPEDRILTIRHRLELAVERLGAWASAEVDWENPRFMASHALRMTYRENYEEQTIQTTDREVKVWVYCWPSDQSEWLSRRREAATGEQTAFNNRLAIRMAMDDESNPVRVTAEDAEEVLRSTAAAEPAQDLYDDDPNDPWLARVAAAAFLSRFDTPDAGSERALEFAEIFDRALKQTSSTLPNLRFDVMFDAAALAITGLIYLCRQSTDEAGARILLTKVSEFSSSAASAFLHHCSAATDLGPKLRVGSVRVGIRSCVFPRRKDYEEEDACFRGRQASLASELEASVEAEMSWQNGGAGEPSWGSPPAVRTYETPSENANSNDELQAQEAARRAPRRPDFYFNDTTAEVWVRILKRLGTAEDMQRLFLANRDWLIMTNAPTVNRRHDRDIEQRWTRAMFECAARCAADLTDSSRELIVFEALEAISEDAFLAAASAFLLESDLLYIDSDSDRIVYLAKIRARIWQSLRKTQRWAWHCQRSSTGIEIGLRELVTTLYLSVDQGIGGTVTYTANLSADNARHFAETLSEVAMAAPHCQETADLYLKFLELLSGDAAEPLLRGVAMEWARNGTHQFWKAAKIGPRVCSIAGGTLKLADHRDEWLIIADAIGSAGLPEGEALKKRLRDS